METHLAEENKENSWMMAVATYDKDDVAMKTKKVHKRDLTNWIIDSGAMTHVVRLVVHSNT